ncbi:transcriptional protein SWT1 isoform X1 [Drosophila pseudoobscura]|uniref:Transcriptional protein SWT1 isoform X1 n=1 Tax=Drosophila pseudoobscura pseudoobscura TaxID=46245 RepID=A0A6I8V0D9_DROPS|nr:transcriptional protein SWT1 isoform X1 [Drosophila pseudoobscura]
MFGYGTLKNGSKLGSKTSLAEGEAMQTIYNHRQSNARPTNKQPAQNRLKRLQIDLKRRKDKKPNNDNQDSKRSHQNALSSASQTISSNATSGASHSRWSSTFAPSPSASLTPETSTNKQPAQNSLKRLQIDLKRRKDKKPNNDYQDSKRSHQNALSSASQTISSNATSGASHSRWSLTFAPSPSASLTPETSRSSQSSKCLTFATSLSPETPRPPQSRRSNAFASSPSPSPLTPDTPQSRRSNFLGLSQSPLAPAKSIRERLRDQAKTWEKPKALLDSSNRVQSGSSTSANQRLTQFRASLRQQEKQEPKERNNNGRSILPDIPNAFIGKKPKVAEPEPDLELEQEPMDWEDCDLILNKKSEDGELNELPARRLDHMYFVLDTNVLMHSCSFVEDLTKVVLPGTVGSMLFIPYIVIKELDRLKARKNDDNNTRQMAIRAIRFLNKKFDESLEIQAQSAEEESEHLIEVDCGDDSVVNCCLQLKKEVPHMILLTNDANLRLKAKSSAIPVSTHSDLKAAYTDEFAALD